MPMFTTAWIRRPLWPRHSPDRTTLGERAHAVEHLVDVAHDVATVDDERAVAGKTQGDVERRAILGRVDVLAAEHRVAS